MYDDNTQSTGFKRNKLQQHEKMVVRQTPGNPDHGTACGGHEKFEKMAPHTSVNPWGGSEDIG